MSRLEQDLRDLLARRSEDVPPRAGPPPRSLLRRARRRIALNAVALGAAAVVLGVGSIVGVRVLTAPGPEPRPASPTPTVVPSPSATPAGPAACLSEQLSASATLQGAAGSREGSIRLTNLSTATCTLQGTPTLTLLDAQLRPITDGFDVTPTQTEWEVDGRPQPDGWPVVTLAPGQAASVRIRWTNWCANGGAAPLWRLAFPGGATEDVAGADDPPPCNGPGLPATIDLGPVEPAAP